MSQIGHPLSGRVVGKRFSTQRYETALAFLFVAGVSAWILLAFHDSFWWPPDDGAYAHVAERLLSGEVLNRDVQDVHAGYINFVNAGALALFGLDLVSLRYPLALLTFLQACLVFGMLRPKGAVVAAAGGIGMAALGFVQFLNPTAHWYALSLLVALLAVLTWMPPGDRRRLVVAGFIVATIFLFRQLSGVLVAIGVLTYLLCETPGGGASPIRGRDRLAARALLAVMGLGLAGYLLAKTDVVALVLVGLAPLGIVAWAWRHTGMDNRQVGAMLLRVGVGGLAALTPLFLYHLVHGSLGVWIDDTVLAAFALTELTFFEQPGFLHLLILSAGNLLSPAGAAAVINGLYWIAALLIAPALGLLTLRGLLRDGGERGARAYLLPLLACFYALVAVHYQIAIYLFYPVSVSLAGLLWLAAPRPGPTRPMAVGLAAFLCAAGLYFHAAQPLGRDIVAGERTAGFAASGIARADLWLEPGDAAGYREIIDLIQRETPEDATILALPVNPELYFLSGRRNPTRFYNSALGIRNEDELQEVLEILRREPPALVFFRPEDKYNTRYAARIMDAVRARYEPLAPRAGFEIFRRPAAARSGQAEGGAP